jgi:hypothetical protein
MAVSKRIGPSLQMPESNDMYLIYLHLQGLEVKKIGAGLVSRYKMVMMTELFYYCYFVNSTRASRKFCALASGWFLRDGGIILS